jgi:hypothetical protein
VFKFADEDWDWFKLIMNDYVVNGHLKKGVVRHQASIFELPHGPQSNSMTVGFLKLIKLQMLYVHYLRIIDCNGVQSLDYMVRVEVEQEKLGHIRTPTSNRRCYHVAPPNSRQSSGIG